MKRWFRRWYGPYTDARVWKETTHLLADLPVGIFLFTAAVTMLSTSAGLLITLVGLPLLVLTVVLGRLVSPMERARTRALLDLDLSGFTPLDQQGSVWQRAKTILGDAPGWKGIAYSMVMLPWGIITFTLAVVLWSVAWALLTVPLWGWISDPPPPFTIGTTTYDLGGWAVAGGLVLAGVLGVLLVALLPRLIHWIANVDRGLVKALLSPRESEVLARRVSELKQSRDASVESAAGELRRIERDLHDGAQQRLVSVAMNLGLAKERMADTEDRRSLELVSRAHDEAKHAIAELRDLVRGIHRAVLTDRGLDAAVSALAARCPVPVQVQSELDGRLPTSCESTAYFVIAEALTNVAKHSGAHSASVHLAVREGVLMVTISDDGVGGAAESTSGGIHGLHDRLRAVEGRLRITSPPGGPTNLIAGGAVRIVIAEDSVLFREGLTRLLAEYDHEVVAALGDATGLRDVVAELVPDLVILDVRMPPTHTDEGLRAAVELRSSMPAMPVLVLSQYVEERYATHLLALGAVGVGYLLKERVADVREFVDAAQRVASGGTALDPEVVSQLLVRSRRGGPLDTLTPREREVLGLMAQGLSNVAIAETLVVSAGAVEKHISNIFTKLDLPPSELEHRRVLAVLRYLGE